VTEPFNPLDMDNLGVSIANAMLTSGPTPLADVPVFYGAGIYAIYYGGALSMYELLVNYGAVSEFEVPIYVGKAIPSGGRRGLAVEHGTTSRALSNRLREHARSIEAAENLDLADFTCRWLVVEPIWIPLGENVMISRFAPVWNVIVDGFGNHDPGAGRRAGMRSRWDTLHPGRPWAPYFAERPESVEAIAADVIEYLRARYQV
jgi:Eco29kI restriction endonuclease